MAPPTGPRPEVTRTLSQIDTPSRIRVWTKHGKYVLAGGLGCWWLDLQDVCQRIYSGDGGWIRKFMLAAIGFHGLTVIIFLYLVVFLPWLRGYIPNYPKWQQSARLRVLVPVLTATIFLGWSSLVVSLSQAGKRSARQAVVDVVKGAASGNVEQMKGGKGLGVFASMLGATALYTLTLGLLGLIPAPLDIPVRKKDA
ncbi:hypothetical protein P7C73_g2361, partial [Tremellales sp. Uapishka_1]